MKKTDEYYLWCTTCDPPCRMRTIDGKPLTEREADTIARKFDKSRGIVVRPAYLEGPSCD